MTRRCVQVLCVTAMLVVSATSRAGLQQPTQSEMAAAMAKAKRFTQPGDAHKQLERFVGKWTTETRMFGMGKPMPAEKGTAEFAWLMPGRWLKSEARGTMMGLQMQGFMIIGYDNFKQSYVSTHISSLDTAMTHAEGDMDPSGKVLISYGTLDEYLTGEHDKMVKYVWRFVSPAQMVLEVHDLPIGEQNTKVIEVTYRK
jgi:Protein of unknown function (DUF1579)